MGKEHEEYVVQCLRFDGARRSRSSGASFHDPIDVTTDNWIIECEATEKESYRLKKEFWQEAVKKTYGDRWPALCIRFRDVLNPKRSLDLVVIKLEDFKMLTEGMWYER